MKILHNQNGFSAIEIAIFVIAMGFIGGTGYVVVQKQQDSQQEQQTTELATATTTASIPTTATAPEQAGQYLMIPEWGVRMPLDKTTASAGYLIDMGHAYLGVSSLGEGCAATAGGGMAAVTRMTLDQVNPDTGKPYTDGQPGTVQIGDYRYVYQKGQARCTEPGDSKNEAKEDAASQALFSAFNRLEAVKN